MSIHWPIIRRLLSRPLHGAIVDDQRTYRSIDILIAALHVAEALSARSKSRHVGLLLPSGGAFPIAALGPWMLGRVIVPLNFLLKPDELQFVVDDSEIDTIITAGPMLAYIGEHGRVPTGVELLRLEDLPFRSVPEPRWPAASSDDDLGVLLYTSGTSGKPKGVMLTHGNITANIRQCVEYLDVDHQEVVLGVLPQFHTFGLTVLTILPLVLGAKAVYTARFIPGKLLRLIREHKPTIFVAIPSMYNAMLHVKDATPEDFASLKLVVSGGEPLPRAVADAFRDRFHVNITEGYGLTETSPVTNVCLPSEYRPGSVGRPVPELDQRIIDIETDTELPIGRDGEVRMAGPNIMRGYFKRPAETAAAFDSRGRFRTGDIGRFDQDGHLYITGRLKEMLIVGGENVFPREIEEVLNAHPSVKDSGVIGKADPMRGELPIAFIELREQPDGSKPAFNEKELLTWCRARIAGYKVPDEIRIVEALPRNATGKVMRRELKGLV
jgi:long-chain acyl-CoA synthetase